MVFKRMVLLISSVFILVASGCVSIPAATESVQAVIRQFAPPANKARIHVVRPDQIAGGGAFITAKLDGESVGKFSRGMFIVFDVEPGEHEVSGEFAGTNISPDRAPRIPAYETVLQEFLPGKCYFISMRFAGGMSRPEYVVASVLSDEEGRSYVNKHKMAEGSRISMD